MKELMVQGTMETVREADTCTWDEEGACVICEGSYCNLCITHGLVLLEPCDHDVLDRHMAVV